MIALFIYNFPSVRLMGNSCLCTSVEVFALEKACTGICPCNSNDVTVRTDFERLVVDEPLDPHAVVSDGLEATLEVDVGALRSLDVAQRFRECWRLGDDGK